MYEKKENMLKPRIHPLDESFSSYLITVKDVTSLTISFSRNFDSKESHTDSNINHVEETLKFKNKKTSNNRNNSRNCYKPF